VTNFWDPAVVYEGEVRQGKLLADVSKETGVKHLVWSSLDHGNVPHFESKAVVADYIAQIGVPHTIVLTSFYFENFYKFPGLFKEEKGQFDFLYPIIPDTKMPCYAVEDTGAWVLHALKHPEESLGKTWLVGSDNISMNEIVAVFEKVTGKKATALQIDRAGMEAYGQQGWFQQELTLNNMFFVDNANLRDIAQSRKIFPEAQDWETFLRNHKADFKV